MGKWIRRIGLGLGALLIVVAVAAALNWERLERLSRVLTLFDEDRIVWNFSNMGEMFLTAPIPRDGPVFTFEAGEPAALPESFAGELGEITSADFLEQTATTSLLVIRDDRIVFEDYFRGTGPEDLRISWSIAKSFLSTLIGIALADGAIESLDDPVVKYAPSLAGSAYGPARVRDVAMMSSGVQFDEDYLAFFSDINKMGRELALGGSLDAFAGRLTETVSPPNEAWRYVSIDTHVLAMVLRGATGRDVANFMAERLWARIGPEADAYYLTDGVGAAFVLGGLNMRTRDYAKLGRLFLNDGVWEGERIVPAEWARESTTQQAPPAAAEGDRGMGYGYQWWLPPEPDEEFYGIGVYGQYLYVDRKARVIIVKTSADRKFRDGDSRAQRESIAFFRAIARPGGG
ncbi:MAG: serine hydrolase [Pseudomonadota bacterium]